MILVTGFGPFRDVVDNPSARLVRAVHGRAAAGHDIVGEVLPVSYSRGIARTLELAEQLRPAAVLGFGVAVGRTSVQVERIGRAHRAGLDVDGVVPVEAGPSEVRATLDADHLAACLDVGVSDDAGRYVCNAWLHQVAQHCRAPATFVHVPPQGMDPDALVRGLARWLSPSGADSTRR
jgi:pyroglutamyl-peptidase